MQIVVNGEKQEVPADFTVSRLLAEKSAAINTAVVELNGKILLQEQWSNTVLQAGDRLEILVFMGGG